MILGSCFKLFNKVKYIKHTERNLSRVLAVSQIRRRGLEDVSPQALSPEFIQTPGHQEKEACLGT
jgi:hypothetical protein